MVNNSQQTIQCRNATSADSRCESAVGHGAGSVPRLLTKTRWRRRASSATWLTRYGNPVMNAVRTRFDMPRFSQTSVDVLAPSVLCHGHDYGAVHRHDCGALLFCFPRQRRAPKKHRLHHRCLCIIHHARKHLHSTDKVRHATCREGKRLTEPSL